MRREILFKVTMAVVAVVLAGSTVGCGKIKEMLAGKVEEQLTSGSAVPTTPPETATAPETAPTPPAVPTPAGDDEKMRYINAAAQAACMAQKEPARTMEVTTEAITKNGFDQMSYAQATAKYMVDPTVAQQIEAKRTECLGQVAAPTPPAPTPTAGTATPPAGAGGDAAAAGTAAPPKEEAKPEEPKQEEKKAPATAGNWVGNMMGSHRAQFRFTVAADGRAIVNGNIDGKAPSPFTSALGGNITGNEVRLMGRSGNVKITYTGKVTGKSMSGTWSGTILNKAGEGSWSASK